MAVVDLLTPQITIILVFVGIIATMIFLYKIWSKLWIFVILSTPSWGMTVYTVLSGLLAGKVSNVLANDATGLLFLLAPIDQYLITDPLLMIFGIILLGIWFYIILASAVEMKGKVFLPVVPLIFWILGKGFPNTVKLLGIFLPWWLLVYYGLPLVIIACLLFSLPLIIHLARRH